MVNETKLTPETEDRNRPLRNRTAGGVGGRQGDPASYPIAKADGLSWRRTDVAARPAYFSVRGLRATVFFAADWAGDLEDGDFLAGDFAGERGFAADLCGLG
jgi:hypothetical protein